MRTILFFFLLFPLLSLACRHEAVVKPPVRYLALGDSYTIGHGVPETDRFPLQLAERLRADGWGAGDPRIVATTGWTTGSLLNALKNDALEHDYDLVSMLIGVNNQYQGRPLAEYELEFNQLLDSAVVYAGGDPAKVFVLSIPDYAYTPYGQSRPNPGQISGQIDIFNAKNKALTEARGIRYFDITPLSRQGLEEPSLVASDGLHPSGEMYRRWIDLFYAAVIQMLG